MPGETRKPRKTSKKPQEKASKARLSPLQMKAIGLLAEGGRQVAVSEQLGIPIRTLNSWMVKPLFLETLDDRILEANEEATRKLRTLKNQAVATLQRLMIDPDTPHSVAMQVAFRILEVPNPAKASSKAPEISEEVLQTIREKVYGIYQDAVKDEKQKAGASS